MTLVAELPVTLARAAAELSLFDRVAAAVRDLEAEQGVSHVVVSQSRGEIVVIGDDYTHVALRLVA